MSRVSVNDDSRPGPNRAQSEAVGSTLLLGVVVVSVSLVGVFALGGFEATDAASGSVNVVGDAEPTALELTHGGGPSLPLSDLRVSVRSGTGATEYDELGPGMRGDGDEFFDAGETWRLNWAPSPGEEVTVTLVDEERNRVRYRETFVPVP